MREKNGLMGSADQARVEAIERATLASVPPRELIEELGWLLPFDDGRIGRAKAWVPLSHSAAAEDAAIAQFERWLAMCAQHAQVPALRLPKDGLDRLKAFLGPLGFGPKDDAIDVQVADVAEVAARAAPLVVSGLPPGHRLTLSPQPSLGWASVFLGPGFDPEEGKSRIEILSRARAASYATISDAAGEPVACGTCVRHTHAGETWAGIHGMRTLASSRRQGLALRLIQALAQDALTQGARHAFLQVESANTPAVTLYRRLGFETAWVYWYWRREGPRGY